MYRQELPDGDYGKDMAFDSYPEAKQFLNDLDTREFDRWIVEVHGTTVVRIEDGGRVSIAECGEIIRQTCIKTICRQVGRNVLGFTFAGEVDLSGAIGFHSSRGGTYSILATPWFDGSRCIPVALCNDEDGTTVFEVKVPIGGTLTPDEYFGIIRCFISLLRQIGMRDIM